MLSWRTITRDRVGGGKVLMLRLHDDETIWMASPETALDQELVQFKQCSKRYARGSQIHCCTRHGIYHPGRSGNDMPGRDDEMNDPAVGTLFAVLAAKPTSEIRMPAVMHFDLLPNMGRMTPRLRSAARRGCSPARNAVASARPSWSA
jgi:hypothetical protein